MEQSCSSKQFECIFRLLKNAFHILQTYKLPAKNVTLQQKITFCKICYFVIHWPDIVWGQVFGDGARMTGDSTLAQVAPALAVGLSELLLDVPVIVMY